MNEIISSILEAEAKAEESVKNAQEEAGKIKLKGDVASEEIREKAISYFKSIKKEIVSESEKKAEKLYSEKLLSGKSQAEELSKNARTNIDSVASEVLSELIKGI